MRRTCDTLVRDVARVRFATVAFLDRELLANWGFAGSHVRNRYAREPKSFEWSVFGQLVSRQLGFCRAVCPKTLRSRIMDCQLDCQLGFQYELPTWIITMGRWAAGLAVSPCRQSGLPARTANRSAPGSRPPDAMRKASTNQRPHPKVSEQASGQLSRTRRTTFPLRKGLGRQGPSRPYVPCRHVTSCPPSLNLLPQKHIVTTRGRRFSVFW